MPYTLSGRDLQVALPGQREDARQVLRQCLEFYVWLDLTLPTQRFQALT